MRKQHTPEERLAFKAKVEQAQEQMLTDLAENWRRKPEDLAEYLHFAGRFHQYSPRNAALIYAQNPAARFCGSYLFFKERGYYVRKGEQGMTVRVYTPVTFYRTRPDAEWRRLSHASAEMQRMVRAGAYETREQAFFKYGYVFDIGQTTCPKEDYPKLLGVGYDNEEHAAIYTQVVHYCRSIGMPVTEESLHGVSLRGTHNAFTDRITVNDILGDTQKLSTALHELAHGILGHSPLGDKSTAQREFEADALSILLGERFGIPPTETRKEHLSDCYRTYIDELDTAGKPADYDTLFADVRQAYSVHADRLTALVNTALGREVPQEPPLAEEPPTPPEPELAESADEWKWPKRISIPQECYRRLLTAYPELMAGSRECLRLEAAGETPLELRWTDHNVLSVAQIDVQSGMPCQEPGMTFRIDHAARWVYPLAFRQDSEGVYREVGSGRDTDLTLRRQLNERLIQWLHRIEDKGYTVVDPQQETEMAYRLKDGYLSLHYNTDGDIAFHFYDLGYRLRSSGLVEERGTLADAANRLVADRDQVLTGYDRVDYAALQVCAAQEERTVRQETALSPQQRQLLVQSIKEGTAWLSKQNPSMSVELLMAGGQAIGFETLQRAGLQPDPALLQPLGEQLGALSSSQREQLCTQIRTCAERLLSPGIEVEPPIMEVTP